MIIDNGERTRERDLRREGSLSGSGSPSETSGNDGTVHSLERTSGTKYGNRIETQWNFHKRVNRKGES